MFNLFKKSDYSDCIVRLEYNAVDSKNLISMSFSCSNPRRWSNVYDWLFSDESRIIRSDLNYNANQRMLQLKDRLNDLFPGIIVEITSHDTTLFVDSNGYPVGPESPIWVVHFSAAGPKLTEEDSSRYYNNYSINRRLVQLGIIVCVCSKKEQADEYFKNLTQMWINNGKR